MDEFLALAHFAEHGLDCTIARLFNTVGPRQSGQYGMVIPTLRPAGARRRAARDPRRRRPDALLLPRAGHDPGALRGLMDDDVSRRDLQRRSATNRISIAGARRAGDRAHRARRSARLARPATSRGRTSTGSRTCSTGSRRPTRSVRRSGGSPSGRSTTSWPTSIALRAPASWDGASSRRSRSALYGVERSAGNSTTSRIVSRPVSSITSRSMPRPSPPVGGIPYESAST